MRHSPWMIAAAALLAVPAAAQVPIGPERQVNSYTSNIQMHPRIARDASGGFVVVWASYAPIQDGSFSAVMGRRLDASGNAIGAEFVVNAFTTGYQKNPDIAVMPDGGFVVVWSGNGAQGYGAFARRFSMSGSGAPEFFVGSSAHDPAVAVGPAGQLAFAWYDGNGTMKARQYSGSGMPVGQEWAVSITATSPELQRPDIAWLPKGPTNDAERFVVVWDRKPSVPSIYSRTFNVDTAVWSATATLSTNGNRPRVGAAANGEYVVTWVDHQGGETLQARGFTPTGSQQFSITAATSVQDKLPSLSVLPSGQFATSWQTNGNLADVMARTFGAGGTDQGSAFRVNTYTTADQFAPDVSAGPGDTLLVAWDSNGQDGASDGIFAQAYGKLRACSLTVDFAGNGVLDPNGESAVVAPAWFNLTTSAITFTGSTTAFTGPSGLAYTMTDNFAQYPMIASGNCGSCTNCYTVTVSGSPRPTGHVDATLSELITESTSTTPWTLHVGGSFTDVPATTGTPPVANPYYRFVETMLHKGITTGCTPTTYCPTSNTLRNQMALFLLVAKEGQGYAPVPCGTPSMFADVPATDPFCIWIEELARRGVVGGCGGGNYCPTQAVTRDQISVFLLHTLDPTLNPPACTTPMFTDVPASNPFCKWIEELVRRGIASGCGGGNYCPSSPVTRDQMAVFLTATFNLKLYGP